MRKSAPFRIAGQLRCKAADNGFKQVQIAYLALISYLDKLVQPSYTLSMQISPLGLPRAVLGNACHFDLRLITLISALINSNVQTISACKELIMDNYPNKYLYPKDRFHFNILTV